MPLLRLPNWVLFAAFLLALNAGLVNVLALLTVLHHSVSHMTGNVSMLALDLISSNLNSVLYACLVVLCFVLGAFYSGVILGNSQLKLGRRYGIPLSLVTVFIFLAWFFLPHFPRYGLLWCSAAMGIQNAMFSHYKGIIIRTTHLTGVLTDIGLNLGYILRGLPIDRRKMMLHGLIVVGFLIGGLISALTYKIGQIHAFLVPTVLSAIMSIFYWFFYIRHRMAFLQVDK